MKELSELLELAKGRKDESYNFMSFEVETGKISFHKSYESAKNYAERGGQVLVIDKAKVYTYKIKNEEEYEKWIHWQVIKEDMQKRNFYGI